MVIKYRFIDIDTDGICTSVSRHTHTHKHSYKIVFNGFDTMVLGVICYVEKQNASGRIQYIK